MVSDDNSGFQQESILNASVSDQAAAEDELGFKPYVEAIAEFLINPVTQPPLTISIEGEWGSGKSSFMKQLQKTIEEFEQKKFEKELQVNLGKLQRQAESGIRKFRNKNNLPEVISELLTFISGLTQQLPKILIYRTAKPPRTPRKRRLCVSPIFYKNLYLY